MSFTVLCPQIGRRRAGPLAFTQRVPGRLWQCRRCSGGRGHEQPTALTESQVPMKLVIPFASGCLHPQAQLLGEQLGANFINLDRDLEFGYYQLLKRLWAAGESFVVLEEDVVPTVALLEEIWACSALDRKSVV